MPNLAISIRGLTKEYRVAHETHRATTLGEALVRRLRRPLSRMRYERFRALDDVSFDVQKGEVLGVIGRNGAGKSTLLKVLSRITEPTAGEVRMFGRVGSLLEVGTGFHPELTGRENVFLNGAILGMRRKEIERQFDAIVDFAEVERFLDTPVKRYSSGMYVRLAFAVAAHLNPEIMIVDEVLAVGDAEFQKKCLGKMQDVARNEGRTVLFVSHNMGAIQSLCCKAILMKNGSLFQHGQVDPVIQQHLHSTAMSETPTEFNANGIRLRRAVMSGPMGNECDTFVFQSSMDIALTFEFSKPIKRVVPVLRIFNNLGALVTSICTLEEGVPPADVSNALDLAVHFERLSLLPGLYAMTVSLYRPNEDAPYFSWEDGLSFSVLEGPIGKAPWSYQSHHGTAYLSPVLSMEHT